MSTTKILTATVLCSLSGTAFWFGIGGLKSEKRDRSTDRKPDQEAGATGKQASTKQAIAATQTPKAPAKASVAPPENFASSHLTVTVPAERPSNYEVRLETQLSSLPEVSRSGDRTAVPETGASRPEASRASTEAIARPASAGALSDIQGHWAQASIEYLAERRIIQGFPDGTFRPDQPITATELTALTQKALQQARELSLTSALRSRLPNRTMTRGEAAAMIYQAIVTTEPVPIVTRVRVQGAVVRPGAYSLAALKSFPDDERRPVGGALPTVTRAIQQAGGSLDQADLEHVEIHRKTEDGTTKVLRVPVARSPQAEPQTTDIVIQQNDTIVIRANSPIAHPLTSDHPESSLPTPATFPTTLDSTP